MIPALHVAMLCDTVVATAIAARVQRVEACGVEAAFAVCVLWSRKKVGRCRFGRRWVGTAILMTETIVPAGHAFGTEPGCAAQRTRVLPVEALLVLQVWALLDLTDHVRVP